MRTLLATLTADFVIENALCFFIVVSELGFGLGGFEHESAK
jgi:hypothetical protein